MKPEIREYQASDRESFIRLSVEWIEEHFSIESEDRAQLESLVEHSDQGTQLFVAELDGVVIGCGALVQPHYDPADGRKWLEIVKMTIDRDHRGRGIGSRILKTLITSAREQAADAIWLETNDALQPAIQLYKRHGFKALSRDQFWPTEYARCNVQMVFDLVESSTESL